MEKDKVLDTRLVYGVLVIFILSYLLTFPTGWLISDVYSYLNQGMAIADGHKSMGYIDVITNEFTPYNVTPYPLGNGFWIALFISFFGLKKVYLGSLFAVGLGSIFIFKVLQKEQLFLLSGLLIFLFPPLAFFSKSLMSGVPSFFISCLFIYLLFRVPESGKKWFLLCFIAALSCWIRETNLVLLGSICLSHFALNRKWFFFYAIGGLIGILPRLLSSWYYYDDPFFYVLAEQFSFAYVPQNLPVYLINLMVFMPAGLYAIWKYRGRYYRPILVGNFIFISLYLMYSYNATEYSGFNKGMILMGRFLLPMLPFYVLGIAWMLRNIEIRGVVKIFVTFLIAIFVIAMQILVHQEARIHATVSQSLYEKYEDKFVMFDMSRTTNIIRYINPYHGDFKNMSAIHNLVDTNYMNKVFAKFDNVIVIQSMNTANDAKKGKTATIDDIINKVSTIYNVIPVEEIPVKAQLSIEVLKIEQR